MLGNVLLILTAMIWGTAFVFQRVGMEDIEPITFNAARMALAAAAVGAVSAAPTQSERSKLAAMSVRDREAYRTNTVIGGICCGTFLAAASIFQQMGIVYTTAGKAGFITAMYMLLVPVINFVFFRKRNSWIVWLAVLIGVAGMYLLCMTESLRLSRGDALICICAVLFSGHILCCDHFVKLGNPIHSNPVLRHCLGRDRLHAADHCAEVYRSDSRFPLDEPGVCFRGDRGSAAFGRADEHAGAYRLRDHVRRDRAGADPRGVKKLCCYRCSPCASSCRGEIPGGTILE